MLDVCMFCVLLQGLFQLVQFFFYFTQCFLMKSQVSKHEIHIMLKLFPNTSVTLEQIQIFKISVIAQTIINILSCILERRFLLSMQQLLTYGLLCMCYSEVLPLRANGPRLLSIVCASTKGLLCCLGGQVSMQRVNFWFQVVSDLGCFKTYCLFRIAGMD